MKQRVKVCLFMNIYDVEWNQFLIHLFLIGLRCFNSLASHFELDSKSLGEN